MSGPVKNEGTPPQDDYFYNDTYNYSDYSQDADYNFDANSGNVNNQQQPNQAGNYPPVPNQNPYNSGSGSSKALSSGSNFPEPPSSEAFSYMQQLAQQQPPFSNAQIKQQVQAMYGWTPSDTDIQYAKQGAAGFQGPPNQYYQYQNTTQGKTLSKAYGTPGFQQWMDQQQMANDAKGMARDARRSDQESKVKIHMILLSIMMGDVSGAVAAYARLADRDAQQLAKTMIGKLDGVRKARSQVIMNFASRPPPPAYAGTNPQSAARAQDKSAKYTQFVQMSTQAMNELQNTEREIMDGLQTLFRNVDTMWQLSSTFRDEDFRVKDRIASTH